MLDIDQFRVKIKQLTSKIKTLFIHQSFPIAKTDFTSLFLDVEHIIHEVYGYFMSMVNNINALCILIFKITFLSFLLLHCSSNKYIQNIFTCLQYH